MDVVSICPLTIRLFGTSMRANRQSPGWALTVIQRLSSANVNNDFGNCYQFAKGIDELPVTPEKILRALEEKDEG